MTNPIGSHTRNKDLGPERHEDKVAEGCETEENKGRHGEEKPRVQQTRVERGTTKEQSKGGKKKPQQEGEIAARTLLKALICNEVRDTGGNAHQEL